MLKLVGIDVNAVSVGGLETCIELPGFDLAFDIGRCPPSAVRQRRVLCTHGHMDHMGGLAYHAATRDLLGMPPPTYLVPRENHADVLALFDTWRRLDRSDLPCTIVPCGPGDRVDVGGGRVAVPFRSPHRVPCQGYAIVAKRKKLLPAYEGLSGEEIHRRRASGEPVSEEHDVVEVAFTGDSVFDVVEREELARRARLLIIEVTFLDDRVSVEKARSKGHVHLEEIVANAPLFENEHLLFTHFSARYSRRQITDILADRLPPSLRGRVTPLLPSER
jgi:ribonuclease Z